MSGRWACRWARRHADDWVDGYLPRWAGLRMATHLQGCGACREDVAQIVSLKQQLIGLGATTPAPRRSFDWSAIVPAGRTKWLRGDGLRRPLLLVGVLGALLLLIGFGDLLYLRNLRSSAAVRRVAMASPTEVGPAAELTPVERVAVRASAFDENHRADPALPFAARYRAGQRLLSAMGRPMGQQGPPRRLLFEMHLTPRFAPPSGLQTVSWVDR